MTASILRDAVLRTAPLHEVHGLSGIKSIDLSVSWNRSTTSGEPGSLPASGPQAGEGSARSGPARGGLAMMTRPHVPPAAAH